MKKVLFPLLAVLAILTVVPCCVSCSEKNKEPDPTVDPTPEPQPQPQPEPEDGKPKPGDYTFVASEFMGTWKVGDQIFVHGSYSSTAKTFTLTASDISADGKTATLKLDEPMFEYLADPDYLYAAWPSEAVEKEEGLMDATAVFTQPNILLTQAYLQGTEFLFADASALISFSVSGDFDRVLIAGAERPGLRLQKYENAHSSAQTSFNKFRTDGYPFREEELVADGSLTCLWFPGRVTLTKGFTLYFGKDGNWPMCYTYTEDVDVKSGRKLELGDITSQLVEYTGLKPSMPEVTNMTKYAVKFNELSGICLSADEDFLWGVDDNGGLGKFSFDGEVLFKKSFGGEWEGIALDPETGDILIGNEEPVSIYRLPAPDFAKKEKLFEIPGTSGFGNAGLEGLTYYKDGMILAGMQTGAWLFCCELATGEVVWKKELRKIFPSITEIGGLCYDPLTDWLWVIDSETHKMTVLTGDAEHMLGSYQLKSKSNEEALFVDHGHSCVWVGDDYGSTSYIYKYEFDGLDDYIIEK